jgi:hypothetical protein
MSERESMTLAMRRRGRERIHDLSNAEKRERENP